MKGLTLFSLLFILIVGTASASAQLLEMAADCDKALSNLSEILRAPGPKSTQKIKELLGVDVLVECETTEGRISCFQCLGSDKELKLIQILRKSSDGPYENLGLGCRCKSSK
ncbi:MAG: hypothetical protein PHS86_12720 [Syntrophaceae bacterium]|nr:hypothetical protein [Syntrophaceae bacterium]